MKFGLRKISVKLLAFNILLLSLPMASILYLDTYESQLLKAQENSMIQQGRMLSAALNASANLQADARRIIGDLRQRVDSRIRIVDEQGMLLADSARQEDNTESIADEWTISKRVSADSFENYPEEITAAQDTLLYRIAVYPLNALEKLIFPPSPDMGSGEYYSGKTVLDGDEIKAALSGRYGAATRLSTGGQRSINLYSALPVYSDEQQFKVCGAVLVSRSTYQILSYLYELRLDIIRIFLLFLAISVLLSIILARSITIPVVKLKNEAGTILDSSGNFRNHFTGFKRGDEIGELSRSLTKLSGDLENKMEFIDRFTSDMLHELKNPLSAIKASAEIASKKAAKLSEDPDLSILLNQILDEEKRMERQLGELREISSLENMFEIEKKEDVNLSEVLPVILSRYSRIKFTDLTGKECGIRINIDRLVQAVTNPVDNALSFSSEGSEVEVRLFEDEDACWIEISDAGPGVPAGTEQEVFRRFYSDRSDEDRKNHSGLGLSIVQAITDYYNGSCSIENRESGGCRFVLSLPKA